jgi:hypothetical protein
VGFVRHFLEQVGDAPHLGLHPCRRNHRPPVPVSCRRTTEDHVGPISRSCVVGVLGTGTLSPVSAASAVCSAVDLINRASAGMVSPSSEYEVAGHKLVRQDAGVVPYDVGVRRRHLAQGRGLVSALFLSDVFRCPGAGFDSTGRAPPPPALCLA